MNRRLLVILALVLAAVAVAAGLMLNRLPAKSEAPGLVGGPFHLVDQDGKAVDEGILKGKWSAVFFGFTYCPDACPTTLTGLKQTQDLLGPRAKDFQTVFVSLDPARDTPVQMKSYLSNDAFPKGSLGLTGTQAQTDAAAKVYRVYHQKNGEGADYLVDHSVVTYLMSPKGRFVCALPAGLTPDQTADRIGKAMRDGPNAENC